MKIYFDHSLTSGNKCFLGIQTQLCHYHFDFIHDMPSFKEVRFIQCIGMNQEGKNENEKGREICDESLYKATLLQHSNNREG